MRYLLVFYQYTSDYKDWFPSRRLVLCEGFPAISKLETLLISKPVIKEIILTNILEISQQDAKNTLLIPIEI